jgi:hypothetical protein
MSLTATARGRNGRVLFRSNPAWITKNFRANPTFGEITKLKCGTRNLASQRELLIFQVTQMRNAQTPRSGNYSFRGLSTRSYNCVKCLFVRNVNRRSGLAEAIYLTLTKITATAFTHLHFLCQNCFARGASFFSTGFLSEK